MMNNDNLAGPSSPAGSSKSSQSQIYDSKKSSTLNVSLPSPASSTISTKSKSSSVSKTSTTRKRKASNLNLKGRTKHSKSKVNCVVDPNSTSNVGQVTEDVYIVEKIVDKRYVQTEEDGTIPEYFIKWKGWGSAHNTWEPVENLDGCANLLERFEKIRKDAKKKKSGKTKKNDGESSDFESAMDDDDASSYESTKAMKKTREELIEYGIHTVWPPTRIPLELVGVLTIDKHLCYLVKCQTCEEDGNNQELSDLNVVVVRANAFRAHFSHIVIAFYEKNLLWTIREESTKELSEKVDKIAMNSNAVQAENLNQSVTADQTGVNPPITNNAEDSDSDIEKMDVDEDDDDEQKIFIKNGKDLFGLPEKSDSSESSDDDDFQRAL